MQSLIFQNVAIWRQIRLFVPVIYTNEREVGVNSGVRGPPQPVGLEGIYPNGSVIWPDLRAAMIFRSVLAKAYCSRSAIVTQR